MIVETRHVVDKVEIDENTKSIGVRTRLQKWVTSSEGEMLVQDNAGFHRISLRPGDWSGADQYGVRSYADLAWTRESIDAWDAMQAQNASRRPA